MTSIDFFTPVTYKHPIKTRAQQALETVDEYLYLGLWSQFRVSIFAPDQVHPQAWAMQDRENCSRSWTNITLKVLSYGILIFPLIALLAKATLRWSLQVSSIQFAPSTSHMETKLPLDTRLAIRAFLGYQDQSNLAQVANFLGYMHTYEKDVIGPLKAEIEALPVGPVAPEVFQRLLVQLIISPIAGHPKYWVPVADALMGHEASAYDNTIDEAIQAHTRIAALLAISEEPISSKQLYQFCSYLAQKQLSNRRPWVGYRSLEQYLLNPHLGFAHVEIQKVLKDYLTQQAKKDIKAHTSSYDLVNNRRLRFQDTDIDPRLWFGWEDENSSLWNQPNLPEGELIQIPPLLSEVLWTHLQSLRDSCPNIPLTVAMTGRVEAPLPHNFTLTLARQITNAEIFLWSTINPQELEKPYYGRGLGSFYGEAREGLAVLYPDAVDDAL